MGRPEPLFLHNVAAVELGKVLLHKPLDLASVFVGDKNQFLGIEGQHPLDDVFKHGFARHLNQRLGFGMGMWAQPGAFARYRQNDFHEFPPIEDYESRSLG